MNLADYKLVFVSVCLIGILLIASPVIVNAIHPIEGQEFSEIFLLGADKSASNFPYNVISDNNYSIYVGVGNNLRSSAYYLLCVKFSNQTDFWNDYLNTATQNPSQFEHLYESKFVVNNGHTWNIPLIFSVSNVTASGNDSTIKTITINGWPITVDASYTRNNETNGFYYELLIELWTFNPQAASFVFTNFVNLQLNLVGDQGSLA